MAISVEDTYPGRAVPGSANYPEGAIINETVPDSSDDGTPLDELWGNDFEGVKQALMRSNGTVPTAPGNIPDTAVASQILQSLIELSQGRATNYDDSGVADAYVLDPQANQQAPANLFDGQEFTFTVGNTNAGTSTADLAGIATKNIINTSTGGELLAGKRITLIYRLGSDDCEIKGEPYLSPEQAITSAGLITLTHNLGVKPSLIQMRIICRTVELNYAIGNELMIPMGHDGNDTTNNSGVSVTSDGTNIFIRYGLNANVFYGLDKTTGGTAALTNANWKVIMRAWK